MWVLPTTRRRSGDVWVDGDHLLPMVVGLCLGLPVAVCLVGLVGLVGLVVARGVLPGPVRVCGRGTAGEG